MLQDIKRFVRSWNLRYPIDKWWRLKYNVPFNSPQHNATSLLDMRIEYEEFLLYARIRNYVDIEEGSDAYKPGRGDWLDTSNKPVKATKEEIDNISLDDIDLDALNNGSKSITIANF